MNIRTYCVDFGGSHGHNLLRHKDLRYFQTVDNKKQEDIVVLLLGTVLLLFLVLNLCGAFA
jgi:hypothetical protein